MTSISRLVLWAPRLLGIATCLFIGMFALDAFSGNKPLSETVGDFAVHLIPAAVLLFIVVLSWRRPWIGGATFLSLAALYALTMSKGRLDWVLVISGPLLVVGVLFVWSWYEQRALHQTM